MTDSTDVRLAVALAEIERLRARIAELEAALHRRGTPIAQNYPPSGTRIDMRKIDG